MTNLFLAVLPTIIIIVYIMKFDRFNPEPTGLLIRLFIAGCFSVIPAVILENLVEPHYYDMFTLFLYCVEGIALMEEGVKYVLTRLLAYRHSAFDEIYDGIIYCVMVSLGFATIENILYVWSYGSATAITRMLTAVPAHAIFAVSMGYYMGMSKAYPNRRTYYTIMSFVSPVLAHALYDFILFVDLPFMMIIFLVYLIYLYRKTFRVIKQTSSQFPFR